MNNVWLLTKKNLKLLLRSKASALIVIFAPLLIILILGLSYNSSPQYGLNIGVYASSFTEDVNSVMDMLQEQDFKIVKYDTSIEECVEDIKLGFVHTCLLLPESLAIENSPKEVTFYIDPSRINLVWMIQETLGSKFDFKSQEISQQLTQNILSKLSDTKTKIGEKKNILSTVREKTASAATAATTTKESLSGIDVSAPEVSYDTTSAIENVTANLKAGLEKISDAKDALDDTNITAGEKATINALLNDADDEIGNAKSKLNKDGADGVVGVIANLKIDFDNIKAKLATVGQAVGSSSTNLDVVNNNIAESVTSIDSVLATLNEIETNLADQKVTEPGTIVQPLTTKIERVGEEGTFLNYLFPALLVLVVMFSSLLLGTTLVMMEKNSPAFLRNFFLPIRKTTFIISIYLTNLILILVQIAVILIISLFFLSGALANIPAITLVLFIAASVFTFLGMAIGYVFVSEETGVLASISVGSIFLFVSGVVLPVESISPFLRQITLFNPFVISEKIIREIFIFDASLAAVGMDLAILIGYALVLFLIIVIIESILHQRLVHRFMRVFHKKHRQKDKMNKNEV
jgi:ABC-type transport system involved in cytochrome c biogenesis permease component